MVPDPLCVDSFARYAEELATTRVLKHSSESANGSCGENLAWASYDQSGELSPLVVSQTPGKCLISSALGSEHLVAKVLEFPLLQKSIQHSPAQAPWGQAGGLQAPLCPESRKHMWAQRE